MNKQEAKKRIEELKEITAYHAKKYYIQFFILCQ